MSIIGNNAQSNAQGMPAGMLKFRIGRRVIISTLNETIFTIETKTGNCGHLFAFSVSIRSEI